MAWAYEHILFMSIKYIHIENKENCAYNCCREQLHFFCPHVRCLIPDLTPQSVFVFVSSIQYPLYFVVLLLEFGFFKDTVSPICSTKIYGKSRQIFQRCSRWDSSECPVWLCIKQFFQTFLFHPEKIPAAVVLRCNWKVCSEGYCLWSTKFTERHLDEKDRNMGRSL